MSCHCRDYTRAQLARSAIAETGRGLPRIEPGQPLPAGTGLDRRSFLLRAGGLALSVYGGPKVGLDNLAAGIAQAQGTAAQQRVLVSVFLEGGIDSLSVLAPLGDPGYAHLRRRLAVARQGTAAFGEDERLRWHPSAARLAELHREGKVAVMPAIGYDGPDQSHFTSRHFYEVGARNAALGSGWLGRFLDVTGASDNPLQGLALGRQLAPAIATERNPVSAVDQTHSYYFNADHVGPPARRMQEYLSKVGAAHLGSEDPAMRQAGQTAVDAGALSDSLSFTQRVRGKVAYPRGNREAAPAGGGQGAGGDRFPQRLRGLAELLGAGLPIRVIALTGPGDHDTHARQRASFASDLRLTVNSLYSFQRDLEARGLADRVLIHVWSEFGRRAAENGSLGTDHGAGGIGLLIGTPVRGRMIGEFPGLRRLDENGNLRVTSDFRALYCSILEQWFETDAADVIPDARRFGRYDILR